MNDTAMQLAIEAQKKSVLLAAVMNLFIPGSALMWCGQKLHGAAFFVAAMVLYAIFMDIDKPELCTFFAIGAAIGGAVKATRYNKAIIMNALAENNAKKVQA